MSGKEITRARKTTSASAKEFAKKSAKTTVAIVGAGSLAKFLAVALRDAGFTITEIITRNLPGSLRRARQLARKVGARAVVVKSASLDATLLWFCVPDREIGVVATQLASLPSLSLGSGYPFNHAPLKQRFAFHSSGALLSGELGPLGKIGLRVASVHPLMTFVAGSRPSLSEVPFAIEGDEAAKKLARRIVGELGGRSFLLPASRKAAYHAWATMASPLWVAFLVTMEEAARAAGLTREEARRMSLPIIRETLENYSLLGSAKSFSGPFIRGDADTVRKHLALLTSVPRVRKVYAALAESALRGLPVKNKDKMTRLLRG